MKNFVLTAILAAALVGCGTTGRQSGPISEQKLATNFVSDNIKIETKCSWFGLGSDCDIVAIETRATAPTFGGTVNNRKNALMVAELNAKANVSRFLSERISTDTVKTTIAKNIERANDKARTGQDDGQEVAMSDQEAKNISLRETHNETVVKLTDTARSNSSTILRGFRKISEEVVGNQEVAVTLRWDKESDNTANYLRQKFNKQ